MATWYLYSDDGQHLGPVPTEYVARAVLSGALAVSRYVTESDRTAWRPIQDVPEIRGFIDALRGPAPTRDRETTIIATSNDFPSFAPVPSTQREVPAPDSGAMSSERTLIAPAAFEDEMAAIDAQKGLPPKPLPAAGFQDDVTLRANSVPHDPFGSTLRSPDVPPGIVPRPEPPRPESAAPQVPPHMQAGGGQGAPQARLMHANSGLQVSPARQPFQSAPDPHTTIPPRTQSRSAIKRGPVIAFFLGGLALGALVVVAMLVWAFRGGLIFH